MKKILAIVLIITVIILGYFVITSEQAPIARGWFTSNETMLRPADIIIRDNYAYVSCMGGVSIVDVSNPDDPNVVGYQKDFENISDMVVADIKGDYLYTVSFDRGNFVVIDVSDPSDPKTVNKITGFISPVGTHIKDDYIYVTDSGNHSFHVIDISNPGEPVEINMLKSELSYYYLESDGAMEVHALSSLIQPLNFYIENNYAYVALGAGNGLSVINISDPYSLEIIGGVKSNDYMDSSDWVCVKDNYAYVLSWGLGIDEKYHFSVLDVSNPTRIKIISTIPLDYLPSGINCLEKYIVFQGLDTPSNPVNDTILSSGRGYLEVVNVSNPYKPEIIYEWYNEHMNNNYFNVIEGKYMYITRRGNNTNGFTIIELPDWIIE